MSESPRHQRVTSKDIDSLFEVSGSKNNHQTVVVANGAADSDIDLGDSNNLSLTSPTANSANEIVRRNGDYSDDDDENGGNETAEDLDELLGVPPSDTRARTNTIGGIDVSETSVIASTSPQVAPSSSATAAATGFATDKQKQRAAFEAMFPDSASPLNSAAAATFGSPPIAATVSSANTDAFSSANESASISQSPSSFNVFEEQQQQQQQQPQNAMGSVSTTTAKSTSRPFQKRFKITSAKDFDAAAMTSAATSSPLLSPTSTTNAASPPRPSLMTAPVVQIPLPGLADIFDAVEKATNQDDDNTHLPFQPHVKLVVEPRYELPSALDMPQRLRCDFCLKYDSLCFNCHKKWKDIELPQRRTALLARFAELPEGARLALFFTSCARGDIDFVKVVLGAYPSATRWMSELTPTKLDMLGVFQSNKNHRHEAVATTGGGAGDDTNVVKTLTDSWDEMFLSRPGMDLETIPPPKFLRPGLLRFLGRHTALHVAVAYDHLDIAKLLIEHSTSLIRCEKKLLPFQLLPENPDPDEQDDDEAGRGEAEDKIAQQQQRQQQQPQQQDEPQPREIGGGDEHVLVDPFKQRIKEWHKAFHDKPVMSELIVANKARGLRQRLLWSDAHKVYDRLLKINPRNEHALCGRAKMYFDQGLYDECIKQCRDVLQLDMFGGVQWIDFDSSTVHYLMESALKVIHDRAHAEVGGVLKSCGCVHTGRVRLNLLVWMKQELFAKCVCPFIDVQSSFALVSAFSLVPSCAAGKAKPRFKRHELGRVVVRALQLYVTSLPPATLTPQLYANAEIAAVLNQLRFQLPRETKEKWLAPFTSRGFSVVAFCDFTKILVKAVVEAYNPAYKKGVFARFRKSTPELIAVVKEFEIRFVEAPAAVDDDGKSSSTSRGGVATTAAAVPAGTWNLVDSSDWEVDETIQMLPQQK